MSNLVKYWIDKKGKGSRSTVYFTIKNSKLIQKDDLGRLSWTDGENIASPEEVAMLLEQLKSNDVDIIETVIGDLVALSTKKVIPDSAVGSIIEKATEIMKKGSDPESLSIQADCYYLILNIAPQAKKNGNEETIKRLEEIKSQAYTTF